MLQTRDWRRALALTALVSLVYGCSGEASARAECEALQVAYCAAVERCTFQSGPAEWRYQGCASTTKAVVACDDAESVGKNYDTCLSLLREGSCDVVFNSRLGFLQQCVGVIQLK